MIIDQLIDNIIETGNPSVVGLDPTLSIIPPFILQEAFKQYGETLKGASKAILEFNKALIDECCDLIPAVKPQIGMYEQFGYEGIKVYIETVQYAKQKGLIVIGDVKRGDIASTAEAYSIGHLGKTQVGSHVYEAFSEDFITINAYLGYDSVAPYIPDCKQYNKGVFILVKTSNPNSGEIQDLIAGGRPIYAIVGSHVSAWGKALIGKYGFSSVGAVVGATHKEQAAKLRKLMPHTFFLVPGYGAQGGRAEDLAVCFNKKGIGALINSSRGIIAAYKDEKYKRDYNEKDFAKAARQAVLDMKADIIKHINVNFKAGH